MNHERINIFFISNIACPKKGLGLCDPLHLSKIGVTKQAYFCVLIKRKLESFVWWTMNETVVEFIFKAWTFHILSFVWTANMNCRYSIIIICCFSNLVVFLLLFQEIITNDKLSTKGGSFAYNAWWLAVLVNKILWELIRILL